ncbi:MAG: triose-phosphate isomerase [Chloroflexi bacterium]|nr:triose-phosphate isomerase [Chloroflexota bacterium]
MRIPIIAGNWKMNTTVAEAAKLVQEMLPGLQAVSKVERVVCPPFVSLTTVAPLLQGTEVKLGAQNLYWEAKGAFTGEVSPTMLQGLCQYVIIGHSERRQFFGETDETVNLKIKAALAHGLLPIVCVGENLAQNEAGETVSFIASQIKGGLAGLSAEQVRGLVIAYEPIWAIGTGKAATADGANSVIASAIRNTIAKLYNKTTAAAVRVQYGGSVKPDNIAEFMSQPEIDGALVGGASLKASDFVAIARLSAEAKGLS